MQTTSVVRVVVESGGDQVAAHVGLHALGAFADALGLGAALSARIGVPRSRAPLHDRGKVLVHQMLVLAGGGESCADIEYLRAEDDLFGQVCSDSTLYRTFTENLGPATLKELQAGFAEVRREVWRRAGLLKGKDPVVLDIDASLVDVHSEHKEGTAPTYKHGFGFHPMFCTAAATGEALSGVLRPGNAGANCAEDHLVVLDEALAQLPERIAAGHRAGDEEAAVRRGVVVRADSAGATYDFVWGCRERNVGFAVAARTTPQLTAAISAVAGDESRWKPAVGADGTHRRGAAVAEVTDLVDLSEWPSRTRLLIRREPLHPGAQRSLFPSLEYRYWGHYTDQLGAPSRRDLFMRGHASIEDTLGRLKDAGLLRFPFVGLEANRAWLAEVCFAHDLVRWFQRLCLTGDLASAEPKTLRWRLWHAPARKVRSGRQLVVRILDSWPDATAIMRAHRRIVRLI
jgi:hypothetical protein